MRVSRDLPRSGAESVGRPSVTMEVAFLFCCLAKQTTIADRRSSSTIVRNYTAIVSLPSLPFTMIFEQPQNDRPSWGN